MTEAVVRTRLGRDGALEKEDTAPIAIPTAVTGFYGQNVPYPGFGHHAGFISSVAIIIGLAGLLFLAFKRAGWP